MSELFLSRAESLYFLDRLFVRFRLLELRQLDGLLDHAFFCGGQAYLEFMLGGGGHSSLSFDRGF